MVIDRTAYFILLIGLFLTFAVIPFDEEIRWKFVNYKIMSDSHAYIGDVIGQGVPSVAIATAQLVSGFGGTHLVALGVTFAATYALKYTLKRYRPNSEDRTSFPSGHTSIAFASAFSLAYGLPPHLAAPFYALAAFTALSRLSDDAHWFSDTIFGGTLGAFCSRVVSVNGWGGLWVFNWPLSLLRLRRRPD